ncbi:MAG TPA: OmpW family outer membrane protein, partial [Thermoanaerobaculia bacterium]|nr:OmpW family outer membrane protein [Thermoanaerobaculia bacterium]
MKYAVALFLLIAAAPLAAQDADMQITAWVSQVEIESEDDFSGFQTDFEDGFAMGVSVNRFFNRFASVEASVFDIRSEASLLIGDAPAISIGDVNLTPVMLGVQLHLAGRSRFDPYVGA